MKSIFHDRDLHTSTSLAGPLGFTPATRHKCGQRFNVVDLNREKVDAFANECCDITFMYVDITIELHISKLWFEEFSQTD